VTWMFSGMRLSCIVVAVCGFASTLMQPVIVRGEEISSQSASAGNTMPRLACRYSGQPIDPRCLDRSGAVTLKGERVTEARGHRFPADLKVYAIDLKSLPNSNRFAITRRGAYIGVGASTFELFQGDRRFRPARWPERGFVRTIKHGAADNTFVLPADLFDRFAQEPFLWMGGYQTAQYAFETSPVKSADPATHTLTVDPPKAPPHIRDNFPFYLFNAFSALSQPGDYVFDQERGVVYAAATEDSNQFEIGTQETLLEIIGAQNLELKGLKLEKSLGTALVIRDSNNVTIDGCSIRHSGKGAIVVKGGSNVVISNCRIEDTAETAVDIQGGDRTTLTPAGHAIMNSDIRSFGVDSRSYRPGIQIGGVGIRIEGNHLEDGPHAAIIVQGNDHLVRGNRIHNVVQEANDAGAIYMGRDWTERGTVIDSNWFSEIGMTDGPGGAESVDRTFVSGVYLDDQESGFRITRNIFDRVSRPVVIHGGRDNIIEGNAFLRCSGGSGIFIARRGEGLTGGTLQQRLQAMPYKTGLWATRYPALVTIENNRPADPIDNQESGNLALACPLFVFQSPKNPLFWNEI